MTQNDLVEVERKPIFFDIPVFVYNPEACKKALEEMDYQLKVKYSGKYIFSHEEKLQPFDSKGNSVTTRRHYFVDVALKDWSKAMGIGETE